MIELAEKGKANKKILYKFLKEKGIYNDFITYAKQYDINVKKNGISSYLSTFNSSLNKGDIRKAFMYRFSWDFGIESCTIKSGNQWYYTYNKIRTELLNLENGSKS